MNMNENRASQIESMLKNLPQAAEQGLSGLNVSLPVPFVICGLWFTAHKTASV